MFVICASRWSSSLEADWEQNQDSALGIPTRFSGLHFVTDLCHIRKLDFTGVQPSFRTYSFVRRRTADFEAMIYNQD
jgi:hypothetical protein